MYHHSQKVPSRICRQRRWYMSGAALVVPSGWTKKSLIACCCSQVCEKDCSVSCRRPIDDLSANDSDFDLRTHRLGEGLIWQE
jgi:hypothetical protein